MRTNQYRERLREALRGATPSPEGQNITGAEVVTSVKVLGPRLSASLRRAVRMRELTDMLGTKLTRGERIEVAAELEHLAREENNA